MSVKLGEVATIKTLFINLSNEPVHVTVTIKNKHGHVVTALGSHTLQTPLPKTNNDEKVLFEIRLKLSLEAGEYTFSVSLGNPYVNGQAGLLLDESPWLGPIRIDWNYQDKVPPFYGMVGLEAESEFITNSSNSEVVDAHIRF